MQIFESGRGKISSRSTWRSFGSETAPGKSHVMPDKINRGNICMQGEKISPRLTSSQRKESS